MTTLRDPGPPGRLTGAPRSTQWALLILSSLGLAWIFHLVGLPAAFLVGPLLAGILLSTNGSRIRVPPWPYLAAQAAIGNLIAHSITADIVRTFLDHWPLFIGTVAAIIGFASFVGWVMTRLQILPGTTAVWGASPGAATPMMLMAEAFGADARLVAFMQYLRVVFVAFVAAIIASFWVPPHDDTAHAMTWFRPVDWIAFAETAAVAAIASYAGRKLRVPAGGMLLPLAAGTVLQVAGIIRIELPDILMVASFILAGWSIGLSFTRAVVLHALRAMPQIVLSTIALLVFCGGLAVILNRVVGVDPITAYLATSPGGIDSVGIIATSAQADVSFIMALQTFRLIVVLAVGPSVARLVARYTEPR